MQASAMQASHKALGSGRWFPGAPSELNRLVTAYIDAVRPPPLPGRIVAAIAPHAGYMYSGPVAGHTYRALKDNAAATQPPETAIVLGSCHRDSFPGVALMPGATLETPLGCARLDANAAAMLSADRPLLFEDYAPHAGEHSAENQVPFLQTVLPDTRLVIGLMGDRRDETLAQLLAGLEALAARQRIVVVASTDLLHDADYDRVTRTDRHTLDLIGALDTDGLAAAWNPRAQVCCGIGPVLTALHFARAQGATAGNVLHYRNSGDDYPAGRGSWVVGYGAVVFLA